MDAALTVVGRDGQAATMEVIAAELGARVNTLYHRHESRRALLAALWVRSIRRFQAPFLAAISHTDPAEAAVAGARCIADYCAAQPVEARALTLFRHQSLLNDCPEPLQLDVAGVNDDVWAAMRDLTQRRYGRLDDDLVLRMRLAVQQMPYGLVRPFIGSDLAQPAWLADTVAAAVPPMLALGDAAVGAPTPP